MYVPEVPEEFKVFMNYWRMPEEQTFDSLAEILHEAINNMTAHERAVALSYLKSQHQALTSADLCDFWAAFERGYVPADERSAKPYTEFVLARLSDPAVESWSFDFPPIRG